MIRAVLATLLLIALPAVASAQCYADYKAKRDAPLRLHYGVAEVDGQCAPGPAAQELAPRLARQGWELLDVVGVFGPEGLEERRADAGDFFLRF
ncbi:MAG: hypothetical protein HLUCCA09_01000 [Rhodobacteraceae bacterium HLUCCA09]|nr:MAG: hypothetical protein HLUCCA09_01000 [Rhodobacteraceae bacterium HLUCCA09]